MKLFVIGQCTLHWGRLEFGNIGNYYVVEPLFAQLRHTFPDAEIVTTLQMSEPFALRYGLEIVPADWYYAWGSDELRRAKVELNDVDAYLSGSHNVELTPFASCLRETDLCIDFSGDIWGANADFLGPDRFHVGLLKDRVAQRLAKRTAMIAGSPGPFFDSSELQFAKFVYQMFDLVTNRESASTRLLKKFGFDTSNTVDTACPAFLFKPDDSGRAESIVASIRDRANLKDRPLVGFAISGWNMTEGPFDRDHWDDDFFQSYACVIEMLTERFNCGVVLISHSNGFDVPPAPFRLKHGRDYPLAQQLARVVTARGKTGSVALLEDLCEPALMKAVIGQMDMMVSGRIHAAVAALSQGIPTAIVDYGHPPKAHKVLGFAEVADVEDCVCDPRNREQLMGVVADVWINRSRREKLLMDRRATISEKALQNFTLLKGLIE